MTPLMSAPSHVDQVSVARRRKKVPTLYETDESKYVGPHRWQIQLWARAARRAFRWHAYTRWAEQSFERIEGVNLEALDQIEGPCVFVANHQSHLDTVLVDQVLPSAVRDRLYYGAAQDRWFIKGRKKLVLKPWYQSLALGTFPILRGGGRKALSYAHWLLGKRRHVFLFPEGTRAQGDELGEFKPGAILLALEHNIPVVPIYLAGLKDIRPKGSREAGRGVVGVEVLPPILFSPGSDLEHATAQVRRRMNDVHRKWTAAQPAAETVETPVPPQVAA